jgi:predicted nucleic-acid-binding Zn-ribbon protein
MTRKCSSCGSEDLHRTQGVNARGGYGPDLLPGLGGFWSGAKIEVVVCANCGLTQLYADEKARTQLASSNKWSKV